MIGSFLTVGEQVLILFALMAVGFALGKAKLMGDKGSLAMTNLVMYAVSPAMMVVAFQREKNAADLHNFLVCLLLAVAVTFAGWEACRGMLEPQLSCRLYSCILLMEYALFYAGVIVSVRTHMPHLSSALLVGIIAAINVIPGPISLMLDLPDLNYLSPFYLNWLCAQWSKLTLAGMQLRLLPILLAGLALFAVPACRYARALRGFLTPCEKQ